ADAQRAEQVLSVRALARQAHRLAVADAGRDAHVDLPAADVERQRAAAGRGVEGDRHLVGLLRGRRGPATGAARAPAAVGAEAAKPAEAAELAEDFLELRGIDLGAAAGAAAPVESGAAGRLAGADEAEAVVLLAFLLVAEDVVGVLDFLEAGLGLLVARVAVGVVLPRQLAVGLLDLVLRGGLGDAQDFVVVTRHGGHNGVRVVPSSCVPL